MIKKYSEREPEAFEPRLEGNSTAHLPNSGRLNCRLKPQQKANNPSPEQDFCSKDEGISYASSSESSQVLESGRNTVQSTWEILSKEISFANDHERFWWKHTGKIIGNLLVKAGYESHLQFQYLSLYHQYILPALGPQPNSHGEPQWKSFLTDDFSPVEPSWNYDGSKSVIRFGIEPIGELAGSGGDPYNQLMVLECLSNLNRTANKIDMQWFNHFKDEFFLTTENVKTIRSRMPADEHSSQSFLAFDLVGGTIKTKAYFFPILKSLESGRDCSELVFEAIKKLDGETLQLKGALSKIEEFIQNYPGEGKPRVEMIAVDCEVPLKSRIKIYVRVPETAFNKVCDAYTLGGRLSGSDVAEGLKILNDLWSLVLDVPEGLSADDDLPSNAHRTAGVIFNFEIRPNNPNPEPKLYIPLRHYGKNDIAIAQGLATFFKQLGWSELANSYCSDLSSTFPHHDLYNSAGTQTYVSYSYKSNTGPSMTMYYNPKIFAVPQRHMNQEESQVSEAQHQPSKRPLWSQVLGFYRRFGGWLKRQARSISSFSFSSRKLSK